VSGLKCLGIDHLTLYRTSGKNHVQSCFLSNSAVKNANKEGLHYSKKNLNKQVGFINEVMLSNLQLKKLKICTKTKRLIIKTKFCFQDKFVTWLYALLPAMYWGT